MSKESTKEVRMTSPLAVFPTTSFRSHPMAEPAPPPSSHAIALLVQQGLYHEALAQCVDLYAMSLGRLCTAFVGTAAEAEELVQETFLVALEALPFYRGEGSVKAFLYGIARKLCAKSLERRNRREGRLHLVRHGTQSHDYRDQAVEEQRKQKVIEALELLRPTEREALLLRYEGELSFRDLAEVCSCDEATARKRVSRALVRMRDLLKESLGELP
jgi:RNA polymerase sigma-70 factor, ECF subfamily